MVKTNDKMQIGRRVGDLQYIYSEVHDGVYDNADAMLPKNCCVVSHVVVPGDMTRTIEQMVADHPRLSRFWYTNKDLVVVAKVDHGATVVYTLMSVYEEDFTTILNVVNKRPW